MADEQRDEQGQPYLLQRMLDADRPRTLTSEERNTRLSRLLAPSGPTILPNHDFRPLHMLAAWRVVREMGRMIGVVQDDQTLEEATDGYYPDLWDVPTRPMVPAGVPNPGPRVTSRKVSSVVTGLWGIGEGLPLLPPQGDADLQRWCEAAKVTAHALGMQRYQGGWHVAPLLAPEAVHLLELTRDELCELEMELIAEVQQVSLQQGGLLSAVAGHFRELYGMTPKEATALIALESTVTAKRELDMGQSRGWMESYLRDYLRRARQTLNMADEMRALKELSRVQGLTRTLPENLEGTFLNVIASVARKQDGAALDQAREVHALPAPQADVYELDEDEQMFDRENQRTTR